MNTLDKYILKVFLQKLKKHSKNCMNNRNCNLKDNYGAKSFKR